MLLFSIRSRAMGPVMPDDSGRKERDSMVGQAVGFQAVIGRLSRRGERKAELRVSSVTSVEVLGWAVRKSSRIWFHLCDI